MEKLCRWFERGNMSKKGGDDTEIPVNISGSNFVDKLVSASISVASNINKMQGGNGVSAKIEGLMDMKLPFIIPETQKLKFNNKQNDNNFQRL
jgi:hypothetical protein